MISSGASDDEMDDSLSLVASDVEESGSVTDPALFPTSALCNAGLRVHEELIRVMIKAVIELGLEWSPPEGAISQQAGRVVSPGAPSGPPPTLIPLLPRSSQNRGAPPTRLASIHLHPLLSHQLTALKRKYTSTCPHWMSPWPHISAHPQLSDGRRGRAIRPSRVEPHLHSLDAPTQWLDKRLRRCTLWLCSRSSRPICLLVKKPVWMQLRSGTWGAWQTWLYAPPKPPAKPFSIQCPAW